MLQVLERSMLDQYGNNKGYFTFHQLATRAMLLPNLHVNEDDARDFIEQGLREGKLIEIQPEKYKPRG
jgi:hypothetical protein